MIVGPVRIELGMGIWPAHATVIAQGPPTLGGDVSLLVGSAGACYDALSTTPRRAFELGPCAGFEVGRLHAESFGASTPGEGTSVWAAPKIGGLFAWAPVRWLALVLRLDAAFPLVRPTFFLSDVGAVHTPSAAAGRAAGGVEVRF